MSYRWIDHTAEAELHLEASSERGLFEDALSALGELLGDDGIGEAATEEIEVAASDRAALLASWMEELVFLAETAGLVPERVARLDLNPHRLRATVEGRRGDPRHIVKAVTYHRLAFEPAGDGYTATVVLDV